MPCTSVTTRGSRRLRKRRRPGRRRPGCRPCRNSASVCDRRWFRSDEWTRASAAVHAATRRRSAIVGGFAATSGRGRRQPSMPQLGVGAGGRAWRAGGIGGAGTGTGGHGGAAGPAAGPGGPAASGARAPEPVVTAGRRGRRPGLAESSELCPFPLAGQGFVPKAHAHGCPASHRSCVLFRWRARVLFPRPMPTAVQRVIGVVSSSEGAIRWGPHHQAVFDDARLPSVWIRPKERSAGDPIIKPCSTTPGYHRCGFVRRSDPLPQLTSRARANSSRMGLDLRMYVQVDDPQLTSRARANSSRMGLDLRMYVQVDDPQLTSRAAAGRPLRGHRSAWVGSGMAAVAGARSAAGRPLRGHRSAWVGSGMAAVAGARSAAGRPLRAPSTALPAVPVAACGSVGMNTTLTASAPSTALPAVPVAACGSVGMNTTLTASAPSTALPAYDYPCAARLQVGAPGQTLTQHRTPNAYDYPCAARLQVGAPGQTLTQHRTPNAYDYPCAVQVQQPGGAVADHPAQAGPAQGGRRRRAGPAAWRRCRRPPRPGWPGAGRPSTTCRSSSLVTVIATSGQPWQKGRPGLRRRSTAHLNDGDRHQRATLAKGSTRSPPPEHRSPE